MSNQSTLIRQTSVCDIRTRALCRDMLVRGEDGEEDGFCKTCNCWVDLSRFYDIDGFYQPCKDCYVTPSDSEDEDNEDEVNEEYCHNCWILNRHRPMDQIQPCEDCYQLQIRNFAKIECEIINKLTNR